MSPHHHSELEPFCVAITEADDGHRKGWHTSIIGEHIRFDTEGLESYCFAPSQPLAFDLMLVAAAVELCDKSRRRPKHGWHRTLCLEIPVHDPSHWMSTAVATSLCDALAFLTGDTWDIRFRSRSNAATPPNTPSLPLSMPVHAVMPYSEGLDSRAVALLMERNAPGQLIRVRLGPNRDPVAAGRQLFAKVPYTVSPLVKNTESSGRSRAFKFTALAGIAAMLANAPRIIMAESFQGAIGPALVPVAHAYEDYRNHPQFTDRMAKFLMALFGRSFQFDYPRLWSTKGETIAEALRQFGPQKFNWAATRSCWQQSRQVSLDGERRQCGICAACLLRRASLHAAGLHDAPGTFIWENLSASSFSAAAPATFDPKKITRAQREYAIAGALHMDHIAEFAGNTGNAEELAHAAYRLSQPLALSETDVAFRITDVIGRHRREWRSFVADQGSASFLNHWIKGDQP